MTESPERRLADGAPPATPEQLLRRLEDLGLEATTFSHPPVYTVPHALYEAIAFESVDQARGAWRRTAGALS